MMIQIEIKGYTEEETQRMREIIGVLINTGALSGVKGGQTILHFDNEGVFQGIQFDYWPWKRRKGISTERT